MKVALISCVKSKQDGKHKARDLYASALFKKMLKHVTGRHDAVFVMSAEYGLVGLDDEIDSYNKTLNHFTNHERKLWAWLVVKDLLKVINDGDEVYLFGGKNYYEYIEIMLEKNNFNVSVPTRGLTIGRMLRYFNENDHG